MAQMKMTLADVKALVTSYVAAAKQADPSWVPGKEAISGLINKIMATVVIDGNFNDKLPELDGTNRPFGEAIEEFYIGLVPALAYDDNESNASSAEAALKPYRPSFDEVAYSTRLPRKKFKTTIDYDKYEGVCNGQEDLDQIVNLIMKRLEDSASVWKYATKKELLGTLATKAMNAAVAYTTNSTILKCGNIYSQSSKYYISKKNYSAAVNKSLATLAAEDPATVIEIVPDLVQEIAHPVDTSTGEAAIEAIKASVENASFVSEGTSLSGSTIGAEEGLVLYVKKGIMPNVEVQTMAGAFNKGDLAIPATVKVLDDFGSANSKVWGILVDPRGVKLDENYSAVREDTNGDGDYVNFTKHVEATGFISKHTYVKVFKDA